MDLLAPEEEIVARLKYVLPTDVKVESFPDNVETYNFVSPGGAALVRYNASQYTLPKTNRKGTIIQDRTGEWAVVILHRNLKEHGGVYALLETIRKGLTGFSFASNIESTVLYPVRDGFVRRDPGKWIYQIVFAQMAPEVEG